MNKLLLFELHYHDIDDTSTDYVMHTCFHWQFVMSYCYSFPSMPGGL